MKILGITGGIGCGKSEVCGYLKRKYGAVVILADNVAHELMEPGTDCYEKLCALFGAEYLLEDGHLNRKKIGDLVFKEHSLLEQMNRIVHPAVWDEINGRIQAARQEGKTLLILEAALLVGSAYRQICDEFWYIYAREDVRISRLLASRNLTEEKARDVMARQCTEEEFRAGCDFTVDNSGEFSETEKQIDSRMSGWNREQ